MERDKIVYCNIKKIGDKKYEIIFETNEKLSDKEKKMVKNMVVGGSLPLNIKLNEQSHMDSYISIFNKFSFPSGFFGGGENIIDYKGEKLNLEEFIKKRKEEDYLTNE